MERSCIIKDSWLITKCRKGCWTCPFYPGRQPSKVSLDYLRDECDLEFPSDEETPQEYCERLELEERVNKAIESLPSEDLKLVVRMMGESYTFSEMGKALGISKAAAFKKWQKAKELLKQRLQSYWDAIN